MKSNQKKNFMHSFQYQMICYALLSMLLATLSMLVLSLAVYGIVSLVRSERQQESQMKSYMNYGNASYYTANSDARMDEIESFSNYSNASYDAGLPKTANDRKVVIIVLVVVLTLFFFILYFLLLTRKFALYLEEIACNVKGLEIGDFSTRIEVRQSNELTEIASNFNMMAEDLERAAEEERKSEAARNELITSIAHDLRTPLTSVIGYLELVSERNLETETREHYISVAYRKAKRMQKLIEDLFSYTQYGLGEVQMVLARIDLVKMMEQLLEEIYPNIQESRLELEVEKRADSAMVDADGLLLARAFNNLLGNAIKYGRDGKNLKVRIEKDGSNVIVRITNFGEVIPQKDLENIFRRFFRVDSARTEAQGGTGLGLAIAKNIIELHHGTIGVKSDLDGTEFCVCLPLADA